jgi:hypothetical protein
MIAEEAMMRQTRHQIERLVMQVQSAFLEDSALSLTLPAAQRRFDLDAFVGAALLEALVDAGVLMGDDGIYRRYFPRPAVRPAA